MAGTGTTRTVTATIARVNGTGFQTQEQPGVWLNLSKYANPEPTIPPKGTTVQLGIDGSGFVRSIEPLGNGLNGHETRHEAPGAALVPSGTAARIAALTAAATFLAPRPDAKSTDVLTIAATFESWLNR
jgi:hypothetical protein